MKIKKKWIMTIVALVSLCMVSCGGDDDDNGALPNNGTANTAIKTVFPKARLDSISSHTDHGNIKIKYNGDYLIEYGEYYDNGRIHDGVYYRLKWNRNDVELYRANQDSPFMKVVLGSNGFAEKCLNSDGSVRHTFEYDEDGHLVKYNEDNAALYKTPDYFECQWENGNMVKATEYFYKETGNEGDGYHQYLFTYSAIDNTAALMPVRTSFNWLDQYGLEYLTAMHYAGLLGKGTKNLVSASNTVSASSERNIGWSSAVFSYQYKMSSGLVQTFSDGYNTDFYFYTNISNDDFQ